MDDIITKSKISKENKKKRLSFSVDPMKDKPILQVVPHLTSKNVPRGSLDINRKMRRAKTNLSDTAKRLIENHEKMNNEKDNLDFITKSKLKIYDKKLFKADIDLKKLINNFLHQCTYREENSDEDSGNIKKIKTNDYINSPRKKGKKHKRHSNDNDQEQLLKDKIDKIFGEELDNKDNIFPSTNKSKSTKKIMRIKAKNVKDNKEENSSKSTQYTNKNNNSTQQTNIINCSLPLFEAPQNENKPNNSPSPTPQKKSTKKNKSTLSRTLFKLNNVYDSFSDEEANEDELEVPHCVYLPNNPFIIFWDIISSLFVLYSIIISPVLLAFNIQNMFFEIIDVISDLIFIFDIIFSFFTAYYNEDYDILIVSKKKIALNYISSYFILDVASSIPFSLIAFCYNHLTPPEKTMDKKYQNIQAFGRLGKFYRVLKWTKIFSLFKIKKENKKEEKNKLITRLSRQKIFKILKFVFFIIIIVHLSSCMWIFIVSYYSNGFVFAQILFKCNLSTDEKIKIYILALYFLFETITSVGYGDIIPMSTPERIFVIFYLIIGCMLFSYIITALSSIFSQLDAKTQIYTEKEIILDEIRLEYKMPQSLYDKIKKALKNNYKEWKEDQLKLIDSLPGSLRNNLYLKMHENQIKNLIFFKNQSYDFILFSVPLLKRISVGKDDIMISCGDLIDEMYLVIRGMLSLLLGYKYDNFEVGVVKFGEHFGDISMYLNDQSNFEIKSKTKQADIFCLSKSNFATIKLNFRYAIDELLKKSYTSFLALETKRKMAIDFYEVYGNFEMFNKYYKEFINENNLFCNEESESYHNFCNNSFISDTFTMSLAKKKENDERFSLSPKGTCDYQNEGKSLFSISKQNTLKNSIIKPNNTNNIIKGRRGSYVPIFNFDGMNKINNNTLLNNYKRSSKKFSSLKTKNTLYDKQNFFKNINPTIFQRNDTRTQSNVMSKFHPPFLQPNKIDSNNSLQSVQNIINEEDNNKEYPKKLQSFILNSPIKPSSFIYINNLNINYLQRSVISPIDSLKINRNRRMSVMRPSTADIRTIMQKDNEDNFLENLNNKIENDALLQHNKVFLQDYIMDFLDDKKEEDDMNNMIGKLQKIINNLEKCNN